MSQERQLFLREWNRLERVPSQRSSLYPSKDSSSKHYLRAQMDLLTVLMGTTRSKYRGLEMAKVIVLRLMHHSPSSVPDHQKKAQYSEIEEHCRA